MNSNRFSKLFVVLAILVLAVGATSAVTLGDDDAPAEAAVDSKVEATFTFEELFKNPSLEQWTLEGTTELENVTWTVTAIDQTDSQIDQTSYDGANISHGIDVETGVSQVRVRIVGTVPAIETYRYDPAHRFELATFTQAREGGTTGVIETYETHHYTEESRGARQAIDEAGAAIEETGGNEEASSTLDNAISAYEAGNFDNAISLANQAAETAEQANQTAQRNQLIIYAVIAVIVVAILVGIVYWYRSRQQSRVL